MITLIVGSTGAGKTTYARKIAGERSAVVYSIDNWMKALYWQDMPESPDMKWFQGNQEWYTDRIARCENLIKEITLKRARLNQPSLLDLGFTTASHRKQFIDFFLANDISVETHYLDVDPETRWKRVEERNTSKGDTHVMNVDRSMFEYMDEIFEVPKADEGAQIIVFKE